MITPEMEAMYLKLASLAPAALERNNAKKYLAFKAGRRIVVGVHPDGASFSTEDETLPNALKNAGIEVRRIESKDAKDKFRYKFPTLTPAEVDAHADTFRKLFEHSINLKHQSLSLDIRMSTFPWEHSEG